jgi:2-polyprenyl-3-methyl-5-hydroxy-6-metoxy-1,4-benzoquinol methylase
VKRTNRQITNVETHFDLSAQRWKSLYREFDTANDMVLLNRKNLSVELLCKYLRAGSRILDAGCGAGILALDIAKKSFHVYGIDI